MSLALDRASRGTRAAAALSAAVLLLASCRGAAGSPSTDPEDDHSRVVRVASGPDQETQLVATTMVALLEAEGVDAEVVPFADSRDARQALELAEVDVRLGYTGEAWLETMGRADPPADPHASFLAVRDHDAAAGIVWLRPRFSSGAGGPPANATFAFVVRGPPSRDAELQTMSQLASRLSAEPDALVCVDREFAERPDGLPAVLSAYSVRSDRGFLAADPSESVLGVVAGECLAGLSTATDGEVWRAGLRPLADDLRVFPAFVPVPQVRRDVLGEQPAVRVALSPLARNLTTERLGRWNARVRAGEPVAVVSRDAATRLREIAGLAVEAG